MKYEQEYQWHIKKIERENDLVSSLYLNPEGDRPDFIAGQYLTIKIPDLGPAEGKAYSIASAPHEELVRLAVKQIGSFSEAILALRPGDTVTTSAPYGFFYPEPEDTAPLVFLVGGIGITPCFSIIKNLIHHRDRRPIHLLYSNQTIADITFNEELNLLAEDHNSLSITHFITREQPADPNYRANRITTEDIKAVIPEYEKAEYFICGSMDFTRSLWKHLHENNIPQYQLYTEGFF